MCLAILALHCVPGISVLIAANRDEFHARPTAPAAAWPGRPALYAGRDLQAGGTWMGATDTGRFALVTNYRDPARAVAHAPSRGALVEAYLRGDAAPAGYMAALHAQGERYNGFNLIAGDAAGAWYYSNRASAPRPLAPGIHALSNHLLDTPWPKLSRTRRAFAQLIAARTAPDVPALFAALADRSPADDAELPDTGIGRERERLLSSPFIVSPDYGTRSSSVLILRDDGRGELHERGFDPAGHPVRDTSLAFAWKT